LVNHVAAAVDVHVAGFTRLCLELTLKQCADVKKSTTAPPYDTAMVRVQNASDVVTYQMCQGQGQVYVCLKVLLPFSKLAHSVAALENRLKPYDCQRWRQDKSRTLEVSQPAGVDDGDRVRLSGEW
jgi:molecular chaperone DnaJ